MAKSVLIQALEADGLDAEEATTRVQRATEDMHAILGALWCAGDLVDTLHSPVLGLHL